MIELLKRNSLAGLVALVICIALMAAGCSATEETAMESDANTNDIEEEAAENTENAENSEDAKGAEDTAAPAPGVYAEINRNGNKIAIHS